MSITTDSLIKAREGSVQSRDNRPAPKTVSGLHDAAFRGLGRHVAVPSKILDLGAGTGAWAARLIEHGHRVTCLDNDETAFALDGVSFVRANLNEEFSKALDEEYAVVTAIEVIEHLENPTHFLRQCRSLLSEEGVLLITTPNVECVAGRLRFLRSGDFRMFGRDERFNDHTHITPIQSYMFEKMSKAAGLRILSHTTSKAASEISGRLSRALCSVVSPFVKGIKGGDNHIYTLTRTRPEAG
ncbi:MAG TPA: class I SAM-dependent methyltransferase [Pyrinomonadaceae bacterium]|nr:class I SAM-dependent methyltransferase [Pyrinomonadaceae bacterium]